MARVLGDIEGVGDIEGSGRNRGSGGFRGKERGSIGGLKGSKEGL